MVATAASPARWAAALVAVVLLATSCGATPARLGRDDGTAVDQSAGRVGSGPTDAPAGATIAASAPVRIRIPAIGVDARIAPVDSHFHPDTGEWDPIEPPTDTLDDLTHLVVWWRQRAALSRPSTGTAYVFGHSCARMSCVFDRLHELRQGDRVEITTANGDYDLRVTSTAAENTSSKNDADTDATVMSRLYATYRVPDRVVLMTCGYVGPRSAANSPVNLAVVAEVVAAHPAG